MAAVDGLADVRLGTTLIQRVYAGPTLVWRRSVNGLPQAAGTDLSVSVDRDGVLLAKPVDADTSSTVETEAVQTITGKVDADVSVSVDTESVDSGVSGVMEADTATSTETEARTATLADTDTAASVETQAVATLNSVVDADTSSTAETERLSSVTRSDADTSASVDGQSVVKTGLITERAVKITEQSTGSTLSGDVSAALTNDLMVCVANVNSTCSISSGWTPLYGPTHMASNGYGIWYRFKNGQAADTPKVTYDTSDVGSVAVASFGGVDSVNPFDATISTLLTNSAVTSITVPAVTTVTAGAVVLTGGAIDGTSSTWTLSVNTGWTMRAQTTGVGRRQAVASKTLAAPGSSGTAVWSQAGGSGLAMVGFILALRPA